MGTRFQHRALYRPAVYVDAAPATPDTWYC